MTVRAILDKQTHDIISCRSDEKVATAIGLLAEKRIGALPVLDDGKVVGIFTERDILYCVHREGSALLDQPVSKAMTADVITVEPDRSAIGALSLMTKRRIRHLPVCDGDKLIGFISIGDLVKYRIDKIESEAESLRTYIQTA